MENHKNNKIGGNENMKKSITISVESEKLSALNMYLEQKSLSLDDELNKAIDSLYQKFVPQNVREYIDMITGTKEAIKPKKLSVSNLQNDSRNQNAL